jgi:small-conductance mechanosensitive channel
LIAVMTRMRLLLLFPLLLLAAGAAAQAPPTPAAPPSLTPQQAQQALEVLQDPAKRAQAIAVLEALAKAGAAAAPEPAAIPPSATQPPAPALAPGSLGAQVMSSASAWLSAVGGETLTTLRSVTKLPALWRFATSIANDPASQWLLIGAAWKSAVVAVVAIATQLLARYLLRRPMRALAAHAETLRRRFAPDEVPPERRGLDEAERGQTERYWRPLTSMALLLRRLPGVAARLALELLPVLVALAAGYAVLGSGIGAEPPTRLVILALLDAYVLACGASSIARTLVGPGDPRLLPADDPTAIYVLRWARRIAGVAFFGYALAQVGLLFGLAPGADQALLKLVELVVCAFLVIIVLQWRVPVARWIRTRQEAVSGIAALRNRLAGIWHLLAIGYMLALWLVWALEVRNGFSLLLRLSAVTAIIVAVARFAVLTALAALDRVTSMPPRIADRHTWLQARVDKYYPLARGVVQAVVLAIMLVALFEAWGIPALAWFESGRLGERALAALVTIGLTLALSLLVWEATNASIERHLNRLARQSQAARAARLRTLLPMLRTTLFVSICLVAGLMILGEVGVNIGPLLAGAGVIGIAVGFGSQRLVQDVITGMFLLMENVMQVGDSVTLANLSGTIENLSVRTIRLRALDGSVHVIPFSAVTTVTNMTRDYGYAVLDVEVSVNEDPDRIEAVVREVAREMRGEERWELAIRDDIEVMGVDRFLATTYVVRARLRTRPAERWAAQREFNRRIKHRFDELEIESPMTSYKALHRAPPAEAAAGGAE